MYKKIDIDIDVEKLKKEALSLFENKELRVPWAPTQIGLTYEDDNCENKFHDASGSLDFDYSKWSDEMKKFKLPPPPRQRSVTEKDFNKIVPDLEGSYIESLIKVLQSKYTIGRTRLILMKPKTCLTWHKDSTYRMHIPITTHEGCMMVWKNCTVHMPVGSVYWTDTTHPHTAFNGSLEERIHFVTTVEETHEG